MSNRGTTDKATRQAMLDIQRYLADEIAPLMAADAARALLRLPPNYGAAAIERWLETQMSAPDRAVTVSSYLYHAVKKIHMFSELKLVDQAAMECYVGQLSRLLVRMCPEREQAELKLRLSRVGESDSRLSAPIRLLNREAGSEEDEERIRQVLKDQENADSTSKFSGPRVMVSPRVSMLMGRLETIQSGASGSGSRGEPGVASDEVLASLVTRAAIDAKDSSQFDSSLDRVRQMGVEPNLDRVFRQLGQRLPGWDVDLSQPGAANEASLGHLIKAMHRIVALADTTEESTKRFSSMVYAAIEQFNDGHLAQAVAMFDLAQRLTEEKKVDSHYAGIVRSRAEGSVSLGALRRFVSAPSKHGLLRRVLRFFDVFSPARLLERLDGEPKREVRKLMLSLLEVHGTPCRPLLLARLVKYFSGELPDQDSFYSRNSVFLLRRIPRGPNDRQEDELRILAEYSRPRRPFMVTKEAVGALGLLTIPEAERVLIDRLNAYEQGAIRGALAYSPEEILEILDRTCAALARLGRHDALQAIVTHGLRKEPQLGDTLRRLRHLGTGNHDLEPRLVKELVGLLRKKLPARVLGVVLGRREHEVSHLIRALSGTPAPEVQAVFNEVVQRFPNQEFAEQARQALARLFSRTDPGSEAGESLKGDLELFGLPNLLQTMSDSELTGRLIITESNGRDRAIVLLHEGKIHYCEVGRLRGLDAICQLFERPKPGAFQFDKTSPDQVTSQEAEVLEVVPTILEAMRRHDEFQQDRALVPDGTSLMPAGDNPSAPKTEKDTTFVLAVWREARRGTAPESCEGVVGDAYRVRRLYTHWLESGVLSLRPAA